MPFTVPALGLQVDYLLLQLEASQRFDQLDSANRDHRYLAQQLDEALR